jgi:hypothetical protein
MRGHANVSLAAKPVLYFRRKSSGASL